MTDTDQDARARDIEARVPPTVAHVPFACAERFGDRTAQRVKREGEWQETTHAELAEQVGALAQQLVALGVDPGDRVAVLAETRAEWALSQFAISAAGAAVVPIYPTNSPEECEWVLSDSGASVVICENAAQVAKVDAVRSSLPDLRHVLVIEPAGSHVTVAELVERGRGQDLTEVRRRVEEVSPDDPSVIIYTSGTTGKPKGCVLTHGNLMACVRQAVVMDIIHEDDDAYLFLPLAHVFAQVINIDLIALGGAVAYVSAGSASIMSDLAEIRPTGFPAVPRIFEKVHALFADAPRTEEVYAKVRAVFGGRLTFAISGAAPISADIVQFFLDAGVPVMEGYGLSESTASGTLNTPTAVRAGTIGRPVPGCEVRCAEDGEILMRGPHIFAGYWRNPEATAEVLTEDGWLRTGDLGTIDEDGFIRITGRKKEIIITAGGKNLTPSEMENELRQCPLISNAIMHGDRRPYPVALITLDPEYVVPWAAKHGLPRDIPTLADHAAIREAIQQVLDTINAKHAKVAQIKRFVILPNDFSQETGELTPTLKMRRSVINQMYADVLDALYAVPR
ncbi:AMP-dependent synthetase and ligase [Nostocoides japonicum T1-X7]|uniref:Acyl-CoA synthetase n=1 Tax=Nostocoides japonicum T1-X7 TaxID=1194083 RepID=A0A077LTA9_9MICO|nr:AMP-dependent synthetase/ligase [Tetrasphaera japonica]CCH76361.1 AMP-dependent synthetase and ligase [Tetrasphaera japonica T1-X7]